MRKLSWSAVLVMLLTTVTVVMAQESADYLREYRQLTEEFHVPSEHACTLIEAERYARALLKAAGVADRIPMRFTDRVRVFGEMSPWSPSGSIAIRAGNRVRIGAETFYEWPMTETIFHEFWHAYQLSRAHLSYILGNLSYSYYENPSENEAVFVGMGLKEVFEKATSIHDFVRTGMDLLGKVLDLNFYGLERPPHLRRLLAHLAEFNPPATAEADSTVVPSCPSKGVSQIIRSID